MIGDKMFEEGQILKNWDLGGRRFYVKVLSLLDMKDFYYLDKDKDDEYLKNADRVLAPMETMVKCLNQEEGFCLGLYNEKLLISYTIAHYSQNDKYNLGKNIGLPAYELDKMVRLYNTIGYMRYRTTSMTRNVMEIAVDNIVGKTDKKYMAMFCNMDNIWGMEGLIKLGFEKKKETRKHSGGYIVFKEI